ncbi:lipopolysaccharide assembly protein LapA domain-containing protein [Pseudomonas sp. GD03842]|uniref:lipopolysaccharide assembly protein LapA domain-containing protein n=1 Tax=unclassified Pseudomonas TaxID=196821 RepID=UPI000D33E764|nr:MULTISPECIES: lipopolysaccharide assembly protein LapA domain-containing protein [unclassified Pseudomonas]MDH0748213.1 lipopolysaccharide assembly protein LapA domain-containing protein [Pseudomonas sp. GD03842]RAU47484.1 LapA family protein [Pseudomonas sp. RIT 409]RAU51841.1 LapA family protein [Pseudomonas sp. RIT 412]
MRNLKRLLFFVVVVLIASATVVFMLENQQPATLVLFGWSAPELPVAVPVILALLVGLAIGPVLALFTRSRKKTKPSRVV